MAKEENNAPEDTNTPAKPGNTADSQLEAQNQADVDKQRKEFEAEKRKFEAEREQFEKSRSDSQKQDEETDEERSKRIADARKKEISDRRDLSAEQKKVLQLYEEGVQTFAIAQKVYKFANQQTVSEVVLTIRREHADDYSEVEDVNSTKGYTGF